MIACSPLMIRSETDSEGVKTVADLGGLVGGAQDLLLLLPGQTR